MDKVDNNEDSIKPFCTAGNGTASTKKQKRLNTNAQRLILENATVNIIKGDVDYANAFLLRSFRLSLRMEEY